MEKDSARMRRHLFAVSLVLLTFAGCSSHKSSVVEPASVAIRVAQARQFESPAVVAVSGSVVSPENPSNVAFLVSGKVAFVGPREGDYVQRGQKLASVDPADYSFAADAASAQAMAAKAVLAKAEAPARPEVLEQVRISYQRAEEEYRRMKQLYESKSLPPNDFEKFQAAYNAAKQQYDQAKAGGQKEDREQAKAVYEQAVAGEQVARKRLTDSTLYSPIDGYVASRSVEIGDMAAAGRPVFQLVKLNPVEISVGVPETDIHMVRVGQTANIRIPAIPERTFTGSVRVINVAADPSTRSYMVRITVSNPDKVLRLGMIAEVEIQSDRVETVMSLPGEAIVRDAQGVSTVFVYFPEQKRVYARRVEVGSVYASEVRIKSGITSTDQIVIGGQHRLREGSAAEVTAASTPSSPAERGVAQ